MKFMLIITVILYDISEEYIYIFIDKGLLPVVVKPIFEVLRESPIFYQTLTNIHIS